MLTDKSERVKIWNSWSQHIRLSDILNQMCVASAVAAIKIHSAYFLIRELYMKKNYAQSLMSLIEFHLKNENNIQKQT